MCENMSVNHTSGQNHCLSETSPHHQRCHLFFSILYFSSGQGKYSYLITNYLENSLPSSSKSCSAGRWRPGFPCPGGLPSSVAAGEQLCAWPWLLARTLALPFISWERWEHRGDCVCNSVLAVSLWLEDSSSPFFSFWRRKIQRRSHGEVPAMKSF